MNTHQRLCVHTITTKPWDIRTAASHFQKAGVKGITIWPQAIEGLDFQEVKQILQDHDLSCVSYCRGGFFPDTDPQKRREAIEHNERLIREAHALGAPSLVLVCGSHPDQSLDLSRQQIQDGIESLLPLCKELNVKLSIEPLHPMYADTRSAINTLGQANDMAEAIHSEWVGIAVDVYHLWWDPQLEREIERCGQNQHLFAYHICDWAVPTNDLLLDRELMGRGCINLAEISQWVEDAGFEGFREVEIFSNKYWEGDQESFLSDIVQAYSVLYND